jgi:hypothetical protein
MSAKIKQFGAAFALIALLLIGSSLDKQTQLTECVQNSDGTDAQCEECYKKVYGEYPK